jgi:hypothetical protein
VTAQAPLMELVTLRGGPLDGERRHVRRTRREARFMHPRRSERHLYRVDEQGVWRHAGATT